MVSLQVDRLIELVTDLKASEVGGEDTTALGKDFDSKLVFYKILHDPSVHLFYFFEMMWLTLVDPRWNNIAVGVDLLP